VTALRYVEDDDTLITGGTDGMVRFWDTESWRAKGEIEIGAGVTALAVSPTRTRLVVGARRRGCSVWSYPEGARLSTMRRHRRPVSSVDVAPSGLIAVSGSYDGSVRLWEMDGCLEVCGTENDRRRTAGGVFTPDGEYLVTNGFGGAVGVWTVPGLELLRAVQCHETAVYLPVFSPEGKTMATHGLDREVRFWSTDEWTYRGEVRIPHHGELSIAYGASESRLIAASGSSVWGIDPVRETVVWVTEVPRTGICALGVAPDGDAAVVATRDGYVTELR
jgi:WD40 repeat protein